MYKIEKKYLLKDSIKTLVNDLDLKYEKIYEFYTVIKVCKDVKFWKINSKYFKITKDGVIGSIKQTKKKITKEEFLKQKKHSIGKQIIKKRYILSEDNEKYFIDIYKNDLENLYVLEIVFKNRKDFNNFTLPELFKEYVVKEITHNKRYQNRNLALLGDPKKNPYNIYTVFKDIELARVTDLNKTIFKEMKTSDAVRIILYKHFIELRLSKDLIVQTKAMEGLKEFKTTLRKSIILLNEYKSIFDKKIVRNVIEHLHIMDMALKSYKDLKFIQKELTTIDNLIEADEMDKIYKSINYKLNDEKEKISRFFKTREFAIIFKQYELLLKENNKSFISINGQTSIANSINYKLEQHYKKTVNKCDKYESCNDDFSYKSINKSTNILKTLLKEFKMIVEEDKFKSMYTITDSMSKELKDLRDIDKKRIIMDTYLANIEKTPQNHNKLLKKVELNSKIESDNMLKKLRKSFNIFKNRKHLFK
jgi:CYTH domain-containing protein